MHQHQRLLIYSHDSFGLGHLRRCREIAHYLVDRFKNVSILILSGSPIIGSFEFKARVDFVRIPGVIKLRNGDYTSLALHIDIEHTLALREAIIENVARAFDPHLFLVDKEPLGLRGEVDGALRLLKDQGARLVLGLRDVMDEPQSLSDEWERKKVYPALRDLYDDIWVYGLPEIFDPLSELEGMEEVRHKVTFTGYLKRRLPRGQILAEGQPPDHPYLLVTAGGGGDGEALIDWVLSAYEQDRALPLPALIVTGPFMRAEMREQFATRAAHLPDVALQRFQSQLEPFVDGAAAVVGMGGYNTFCEALSFDKPTLIVPRTTPRLEQFIRAQRASAMGLVKMLVDDDERAPARMAAALRDLAQWRPDPTRRPEAMFDGLDRVAELTAERLGLENPREQDCADD